MFASGDYDAYAKERDIKVSHILHFHALHDTYIFMPEEVRKDDGSPYLVFTPFYNKAKTLFTPKHLQAYPFAEHTLYETSYEGITHIAAGQKTVLALDISSIGFKPTSLLPYRQSVNWNILKAHSQSMPKRVITSAVMPRLI